MTTPHKWAEVIHAYADGKTIQVRCGNNTEADWVTWKHLHSPMFDPDVGMEYRVKPDILEYRVALFANYPQGPGHRIVVATLQSQDTVWPTRLDFVRWLTEWVEVQP